MSHGMSVEISKLSVKVNSSLLPLWAPEMQLRATGSAARTFICRASLSAPKIVFTQNQSTGSLSLEGVSVALLLQGRAAMTKAEGL